MNTLVGMLLELLAAVVVVAAVAAPLVALVLRRRPPGPVDPWFPAGHGTFTDGGPDGAAAPAR